MSTAGAAVGNVKAMPGKGGAGSTEPSAIGGFWNTISCGMLSPNDSMCCGSCDTCDQGDHANSSVEAPLPKPETKSEEEGT